MYVNFLLNLILFIIWFINFFFYIYSLKLQKYEFRFFIFYDIAINIRFSWKFVNIKNIIRKFNVIVNLSYFTFKTCQSVEHVTKERWMWPCRKKNNWWLSETLFITLFLSNCIGGFMIVTRVTCMWSLNLGYEV